MLTIEQRRQIVIEQLMEYTGTTDKETCHYRLKMIIDILCGLDIAPKCNTIELYKMFYAEDENEMVSSRHNAQTV